MRRKLAFLLAAVMTLSLLPFNTVSAATVTGFDGDTSTVYSASLLFEKDLYPLINIENPSSVKGDIEYLVDGTDLVISTAGQFSAGDTVRLQLTNASFMYRANGTNSVYVDEVARDILDEYYYPFRNTTGGLRTNYVRPEAGASVVDTAGTGSTLDEQTLDGKTYNIFNGVWYKSAGSGTAGHYYRYAQNSKNQSQTVFVASEYGTGVQRRKLEVPYDLQVDYSSASSATLTILHGKIGPGEYEYTLDAPAPVERIIDGIDEAEVADVDSINDITQDVLDYLREQYGETSTISTDYYNDGSLVIADADGNSFVTWTADDATPFVATTDPVWTAEPLWDFPAYAERVPTTTSAALGTRQYGTLVNDYRPSPIIIQHDGYPAWGGDGTVLSTDGSRHTETFTLQNIGKEMINTTDDLRAAYNGLQALQQAAIPATAGPPAHAKLPGGLIWEFFEDYDFSNYVTPPVLGTTLYKNLADQIRNRIIDVLNGLYAVDIAALLADWQALYNAYATILSDPETVNQIALQQQLEQYHDWLFTIRELIAAHAAVKGIYVDYFEELLERFPEDPENKNDLDYLVGENYDFTRLELFDTDTGLLYGNDWVDDYLGGRWEIRIPLVVLTGEGDVKVDIVSTGTTANITPGSWLFGSTGAGSVTITTSDTVTARDEFPIGQLTIKENRLGSLNTGAFAIVAPVGFEWKTPNRYSKNGLDAPGDDEVAIGVEPGLNWRSNLAALAAGDVSAARRTYGKPSNGFTYTEDGKYVINQNRVVGDSDTPWLINGTTYDYHLGYWPTGRQYVGVRTGVTGSYVAQDPNTPVGQNATDDGYAWTVDRSALLVVLTGLVRSGQNVTNTNSGVVGNLFIKGLTLVADETAPWGPIDLHVYDLKDSGVTPENKKVPGGVRADWTLTLKTITDIPTLVSGRYSGQNIIINKDIEHQAATVQFSENSTNAWWAGRVTNFILNEEAKYRKVDFTKADELSNGGGTYLIDVKENGDGGVSKMFVNDGRKYTKLSFSGNIMTLTNFQVNQGAKAVLNFIPYVSIQAGYEGPITLGVEGSAIPNDGTAPDPIKIADAISPIKVETVQRDILIGYQWQRAEQIVIKETAAGLLKKDTQVRISITDFVTNDITFGPDITYTILPEKYGFQIVNWATSATGLDLTSEAVNTGGTINFNIKTQSTEPTILTIDNISVKIDRTVPVSNQRPYEAVVWGNAVAANYAYENNANKLAKDTFVDFGPNVRAAYLKVVSSANDQSSILSQEVRVPVGQNYYLVNGTTVDMPDNAKAYIDPETSSTYVPLRFVSNAFGMPDEQIIYEKGVITIIHPTRIIQFTVGQTNMIVNGVAVPMLNAAGVPIAPQTKAYDDGAFVRTFVPFRAVGDAFGVKVTWDSDRQEAIYNEGANEAFSAPDVSHTATE